MSNTFKRQLNSVIIEHESALAKSQFDDASDVLTDTQFADLQTRCLAAIERASGSNSMYLRMAMDISKSNDPISFDIARQIGVAKALLSDIRNDYMKSLEELIHGDIFGDFLEMSDYLLNKGYKDAAAVLAGSTLEVQIKKLCARYGVGTTSNGKTIKTDQLNSELGKKGVYTKFDQKSVTAWLSLRNNAAHGNYSEYTKEQVQLLVNSIRDFITRHPA